MPKILFCGKGGSGKSTLLALVALYLSEQETVLVIDADESNPGLARMMGLDVPKQTLMESLGGKTVFRKSMGKKTDALALPDDRFLSMETLPTSAVSHAGRLTLLSVGKIEHMHEGCACPMGVLARNFLKHFVVQPGQWILVDTEAGLEHFGRGVPDGVDTVVAVAEPSYDAMALIGKIKAMADEASRTLYVVLNKIDKDTEPLMRSDLEQRQIRVAGTLPQARELAAANLRGLPLDLDPFRSNLRTLLECLQS
jgi:CO dehydrogenase maturation factor